MRIKSILDKIAAEGGSNAKMTILKKYVDDIILRDIIYQDKFQNIHQMVETNLWIGH